MVGCKQYKILLEHVIINPIAIKMKQNEHETTKKKINFLLIISIIDLKMTIRYKTYIGRVGYINACNRKKKKNNKSFGRKK
jgi:hypothetical protein